MPGGCLDIDDVVHEVERLEQGVGAVLTDDATFVGVLGRPGVVLHLERPLGGSNAHPDGSSGRGLNSLQGMAILVETPQHYC